ncbi:hypothetical protein [Nocardia brasiliensis]|uniref:hypothetical protein n=1 Tax=Nocardia brasiliensis TaxID=37326 RepID=UPI002457CFB4|nr:hypothetical protein [Nocardia brasiliensis]
MFSDTAGPARIAFAAILAGAALLTACANNDSAAGGSRAVPASSDTADCQNGARATSGLQPALRQLGDNLTALGPAAQRNDRTAVLQNLAAARDAADLLGLGLGTAAGAMNGAALIGPEFRGAADSAVRLRDTVGGLYDAVTAGRGEDDRSPQLQEAMQAFDAAVQRLSLACSAYFSAATVDPTTTPPPTRTTR